MSEEETDESFEGMFAELCRALTSITDEAECAAFLQDLCTYKENEQMAQRLRAAKLLGAGKTYAQVIALTGISSATLSRVSRCVRHGSGGYGKVVDVKK